MSATTETGAQSTVRAMRWGLVGTRGLAIKGCLPAFADTDGADLVSVLSTDEARAEAFASEHGLESGTSDLAAFLDTDIDAVWIASPTHLHHAQATAALEAGKHVLLEKPLAMTASDGWDLVETARRVERVLATGYQARYVPGHIAMRKLIAEGAIGRVTVARTYYGIHRPGPPPEWRQQRATARWGALADVGTHHVDLLRMLLGEVEEAAGIHASQLGFQTDDVVAATLRMSNDVVATLTITNNASVQSNRVEVHGTEGALVAVDTSPDGRGSVHLLRPGQEPEDITGERPLSFAAQLDTVTRAASGEDVSYATGEDGARNLELLAKIVD
jgi:1,5-anhydro-D-fructose reductase (1,5-anhydro-D-mannitol-forming)